MKWSFENTYINENSAELFATVSPTAVGSPEMILFNDQLAKELDLGEFDEVEDLLVLSGNKLVPGSKPLAQAYSGHQFGHYTRLGDGRAHLLGEIKSNSEGRFDLQLKGSGPTPFSRSGDGRASLGPMLREYIVSEAMHALGVPTTRGLSVVTTGESVYRETALPGAVLARIAKSHIRVGTFEYASSLNDIEILKSLTDYTIKRHYPEAKSPLEFFRLVCKKQAKLISEWMRVGFIHGVMNTDNMSISGETIDYGPCAFLDEYNSSKVFSFIDKNGRYAFGRQPSIALWNLSRFAETLLPLFHEDSKKAVSLAEEELSNFSETFKTEWLSMMLKKLGLNNSDEKENIELIQDFLELLESHGADYTNSFRALADKKELDNDLFKDPKFLDWKKRWLKSTSQNPNFETMKRNNPFIIPRNHMVEKSLNEAVQSNSYVSVLKLLQVLKNPYSSDENNKDFTKAPNESQKVKNTFCGT